MRENGVALEHHVGRPLIGGNAGHGLAIDEDLARCWAARTRRACAGAWSCRSPSAQQRKELAAPDVERNVVNGRTGPKYFDTPLMAMMASAPAMGSGFSRLVGFNTPAPQQFRHHDEKRRADQDSRAQRQCAGQLVGKAQLAEQKHRQRRLGAAQEEGQTNSSKEMMKHRSRLEMTPARPMAMSLARRSSRHSRRDRAKPPPGYCRNLPAATSAPSWRMAEAKQHMARANGPKRQLEMEESQDDDEKATARTMQGMTSGSMMALRTGPPPGRR